MPGVRSPLVTKNLIAEIVRDHTKKLISTLAGTLWIILQLLLSEIQNIEIIKGISTLLWLRIISSLFLLVLALIAYLVVLHVKYREKINLDDFDFVEDPGFYVHKNSKAKFCSKCFHEGNLHQLSSFRRGALKCRNCGQIYIGPNSYSAAFHSNEDLMPTIDES
jgi:hypothetical protein